jgi:protein subunit release factor A
VIHLNSNRRESSVRVVHTPTGIAASANQCRSQHQNRAHALKILRGKLYMLQESLLNEEDVIVEYYEPTEDGYV